MESSSFIPPHSAVEVDLAPLAWVADALNQSLSEANQALRLQGDPAQHSTNLVLAVERTDQALGLLRALQMAPVQPVVTVLAAANTLLQALAAAPERGTTQVIQAIAWACAAVTDYVASLLVGQATSPVELFMPYSAVVEHLEPQRTHHPSDLWPLQWQWTQVRSGSASAPLPYSPDVRAYLDQAVLMLVKTGDLTVAQRLSMCCNALSQGQEDLQPRSFWAVASAYFEALALALVPVDLYTKRTALRILQEYAALAHGQAVPSDAVMHALLFFCAQANPALHVQAPLLAAVRNAYRLQGMPSADYAAPRLGRMDPAQRVAAGESVAQAMASWAALAAGDDPQARAAVRQHVAALTQMWIPLLTHGDASAQALSAALDAVLAADAIASPAVVSPAIATEVALVFLYLEALADGQDVDWPAESSHSAHMAQRLERVSTGGPSLPMAQWLEDLYQRRTERQALAHVASGLQESLAVVQGLLSTFEAQHDAFTPLQAMPAHLAQMRGVFALLGLVQPARAMLRMGAVVDQLLSAKAHDDAGRTQTIERLHSSLENLVCLVERLPYQRSWLKQMFAYDEASGAFVQTTAQPLARRARIDASLPAHQALGDAPALAQSPLPDPMEAFLTQARQLLADGVTAVQSLSEAPTHTDSQQALAHAFQALQTSAAVAGQTAFSQAAGAFVPLVRVASPPPQGLNAPTLGLAAHALQALSVWLDAIAKGAAAPWRAEDFAASANAMRLEQRWLPLPTAPGPAAMEFPELSGWQDSVEIVEFDSVPPSEDVVGDDLEFLFSAPTPSPMEAEPEHTAMQSADQTMHIGGLQLDVGRYNAYLNDADEWSRRLQTELEAWALDLSAPLSDSCIQLAQSVAHSSKAVGFEALAGLAGLLSSALAQVQQQQRCLPPHALVLNQAAEEVRRLLHQFAAGFLKECAPGVLQDLQRILQESAVPPDPPPPTASLSDQVIPAFAQVLHEEVLELLPVLDGLLQQWMQEPRNRGARSEMLRILHTLKGSARLAGAMRVGAMAHDMESTIAALSTETLQTVQLEPLRSELDVMRIAMRSLGMEVPPSTAPATPQPGTDAPSPQDASARDVVPVVIPVPQTEVNAADLPRTAPTVRVLAQAVEGLVNQADELVLTGVRLGAQVAQVRSAMQEQVGNVDRLRQQLRELELQVQLPVPFSPSQTNHAQSLELDREQRTQLLDLARLMAESVDDVAVVQSTMQRSVDSAEDELASQGLQARALQQGLLRTRSTSFDSVVPRLRQLVEQTAQACGKSVVLTVTGADLEIDRQVLERLTPAFEHLLRNAVVHGIETAAVRVACNKAPQGQISINLLQETHDLSVAIQDDGAGLQLDRIRAKAVATQRIAPGSDLDVAQATHLLFTAGFSTADAVTPLAGRGMGLDVVRADANALGGRVEVSPQVGHGMTFRLVLPVVSAVSQVVLVRVGAVVIGIPTGLVEKVERVPWADLQVCYRYNSHAFAGKRVPFFWGGALLQISGQSEQVPAAYSTVVVCRSAGQWIAMHVDAVLGNRELLLKTPGAQLARVPGLAGLSLLPSGAVVLIYNPVVLAMLHSANALALQAAAAADANAPQALPGLQTMAGATQSMAGSPLVLVVDDSVTARRTLQALLVREGFQVQTACDGLEALSVLAGVLPVAVLTDLAMPRMDGLTLVRHMRADARLAEVPVIVISGRNAPQHREQARALGVQHYLAKPFAENALLNLLPSLRDSEEKAL